MLDPITQNLEHYMDLVGMRQRLVASNIANADTPGYKTQDVDFQAELKSVMDGGTAHTTTVAGLRTKNDGNNVDLDREARLLAENALRFSVASTLMKSQIRLVKQAIQEGKS